MRIAIVCNDTRGGVQPYVALGLGLKRAGHDVRALAPGGLETMFTEAGVEATALTGSVDDLRTLVSGVAERGSLAAMRLSVRELPRRIETWTREALAVCEGADIVTGGVGGMVVGLSAAEKAGARFVETHLQPVGRPTGDYPGVLAPHVPPWPERQWRLLSHYLSEAAVWMPFQGAMASARKTVLGLKGRATAADGQPVLYGFSRTIVPLPADPRRARHATGYWTMPLNTDWRPPQALTDFLAKDGPVVSIGFGSMASQSPEQFTDLVVAAIRKAGVRAVLLSGWGGLTALSGADDVFCADALPHAWLFPRMSAIVHHGGAGTTGAGLIAGRPAVVVPFTMDQPFWGARVAALGAGPPPIPRIRLTADALAGAIHRAITDKAMASRAAAFGETLQAEDGVKTAVALLERAAKAPR